MSAYPKQTIMVCTKCGLTEPQTKQNETGYCSRCNAFHMVVKAGKRVYLAADEIQVIKKALDAYFGHCGEVIGDYKETKPWRFRIRTLKRRTIMKHCTSVM